MSIELDQRLLGEIIGGLSSLPEVLEVKIQAGREDILVQIAISSLEALQELTVSMVGDRGGAQDDVELLGLDASPVPHRPAA